MFAMKQGWEIKKLGEVCDIVGGSTPKTGEPSYWDGVHYWITPAELDGSKYISSTSRTITDEGVKSAHLQLLPSGTVLLSSRAPIGKVAITTTPMYCNQGFKNLVCSNMLYNEFAYWFLYYNTEYLNSLGTGATFKEISKRVVEQIPIPIPPREEQERIVEELDCLSGVIEKKREQLRELDALAQSIFYTMFGDPITNEKGWEVKKLLDAVSIDCPISYGIVQPMDDVEGGIPIVRPIDLVDTFVRKDNLKRTSVDISNAYKRTILRGDEILMCVRGTTGVVSMASDELKGCNTTRGIVPLFFDNINRWFVYYLIKQPSMQCLIAENTYGIALKQINIKELRLLPIITPPLAHQQEFADKIEAIEKQKALIKQSITQTEELFNARMAYYFN